MAIEDFFRHTCNIYHRNSSPKDTNYGLPTSEKVYTYPDGPSIENVPCYFDAGNGSFSGSITMNEPKNDYTGYTEVDLPISTVIHQGDKVVDLRVNLEYTAGFPNDIRGKYLAVPLFRKSSQEAL